MSAEEMIQALADGHTKRFDSLERGLADVKTDLAGLTVKVDSLTVKVDHLIEGMGILMRDKSPD